MKSGNTEKQHLPRIGSLFVAGTCVRHAIAKAILKQINNRVCKNGTVGSQYDPFTGEFVIKQQCTKATWVCKLNSFSDKTQRWKLGNNKKLENKEGVWKSDDLWIFKTKGDDMIYIENTSKAKVLGATSDGKVIQEFLVEGKADQLWKKGEPDAEGYFTLQNYGEPKLLTAISKSSLKIKGNIGYPVT